MNNVSGRVESIETLQVRQSSESEHSNDNHRNPQRLVPRRNHLYNQHQGHNDLMTLTIVSIPMIIIKDQFIPGTVNTTAIKVITTTMTLTNES
jgi:hypothetical protein